MAHMTTQWIVVLRETGATDHGVRSPPCRNVQYRRILVTLAERPHPFPSRTRKLSSPAPKILRGQPFGKIGRRQDFCVSGLCGSRGAVVDGPRCRPAASPGRDTLHDMEEPATDEPRDPRAATLVCPFLVSAAGPWRSAEPARDHRCARLTRSTHIEPTHQRRYCLASGGPGCPHYVPVRAKSRFVSTLPVVVDRGPLTATLEKGGVRRLAAPATVVIVGAALGALLLSRGPGAPGPAPGGSMASTPGASTQSAAAASPPASAAPSPSPAPTASSLPSPTQGG